MNNTMNIFPLAIRTFSLAFFLVLTLMLAQAQADIDGFQGMKWGASLSEIEQTRKLVMTRDSGANDTTLYALENEPLVYGKAKLTGIHCSFVQGRLNGVILLVQGLKEFAALKDEAFARFGDSRKIDQAGEEMYNWTGEITNTILSYNRDTQSGFLFLKQHVMPEPRKPVENPQAARPPEREPAAAEQYHEPARQKPYDEPEAEAFAPEIEELIDRDLALTRLCWGTTGPEAENACRQMKENAQRLAALGLCMTPREPGQPGPDILWSRCPGPSNGPRPVPVPAPDPTYRPEHETGYQPGYEPTHEPGYEARGETKPGQEESLCLLVGEMFAAAAQLREEGAPPQIAESELLWYQSAETPEITTERIRETVEEVYFNPELAHVRGDRLRQQITDSCRSGQGPYQQPFP
jgi:hypothetical protein